MENIIAVPTLSHDIACLQRTPSLPLRRRRDLISAVRRMSEILGVDPASTPASLQFLRASINAVHPVKHNLTPKTWSTLRSNFRAALVHVFRRANLTP